MLKENLSIMDFIRCIHELGKDQLPNYNNLRQILINCLKNEGLDFDPFYAF